MLNSLIALLPFYFLLYHFLWWIRLASLFCLCCSVLHIICWSINGRYQVKVVAE